MDKAEHGAKLRAAMAVRGMDRTVVADAVGRSTRTITGWTSGKHMPEATERAALRKLLGDYDNPGDPVEIAIRASDLTEWRQDTVLGFYKKHLTEQREGNSA